MGKKKPDKLPLRSVAWWYDQAFGPSKKKPKPKPKPKPKKH
jgi:hypothetical protein